MSRELIFLTGFSFSGKTQTGKRVARRLGWSYVDTDDLIIQKAGKPISRIFAEDGEPVFRELESQALRRVCRRKKLVVATGGGMILDDDNRSLMLRKGVVVCLEARPETIYQRLLRDAQEGTNPMVRPLLQGTDPLGRIRHLKYYRQPMYAEAHWTVQTDALTPDQVAEEVVRGWQQCSQDAPAPARIEGSLPEAGAPYCLTHQADLVVHTASASYPVFLRPLEELGSKMAQVDLRGTAFVISDENVFAHYGGTVGDSLRSAGFRVDSFCLAPGEESKSLAMLARLYDWVLGHGPERGHALVALGGGVVGDLAGLAAATLLRGMPYVQVPTSLLAMVDSSVGGKTAINHPRGKNLIGAFYQPGLVLMDLETLRTLPPRELTSGWAEVVKHALIRDASFFDFLHQEAGAIRSLKEGPVRQTILRSVAIKAGIVGRDERETTGERSLLNYGHTLAHGLETATSYGRFLHGEAVAIGMAGAGRISREMGLLPAAQAEAQEGLLDRLGLPTRCTDVDQKGVLRALSLDKKVRAGKIRWVLLEEIGRATLRDDVPADLVAQVLDSLLY